MHRLPVFAVPLGFFSTNHKDDLMSVLSVE